VQKVAEKVAENVTDINVCDVKTIDVPFPPARGTADAVVAGDDADLELVTISDCESESESGTLANIESKGANADTSTTTDEKYATTVAAAVAKADADNDGNESDGEVLVFDASAIADPPVKPDSALSDDEFEVINEKDALDAL